MKKFFWGALAIFAFSHAFGQNFNIGGEFRFRPEFRNGYKQLRDSDTTPAYFIAQRSRLNLKYTDQKISANLVLQESRIWGDQMMKSSKSTIGVYQAWVKWDFRDSMYLKLGRQELSFDNERLFSQNNWSATGQSFDVALFNYKIKSKKLDIAAGFNQKTENNFGISYNNSQAEIKNNPLAIAIVHYEQKIGKIKFSLLNATDAFMTTTGNTVYIRNTGGFGIGADFDKWESKLCAYTQNGETHTGSDLNAWYVNVDATYKIKKHKLTIGAEMMSGNDTKNADKTSEEFIPLYGSNHAYNGFADYFTNMATATAGAGLFDGYAKITFQANEKGKFLLDYHYFATQQSKLSNGIEISTQLANEIDLTYQHKLSDQIELALGYTIFKGTSTLADLQQGDSKKMSHWAYVSLIFKPTFFKSK